jgi:hypothetical protein
MKSMKAPIIAVGAGAGAGGAGSRQNLPSCELVSGADRAQSFPLDSQPCLRQDLKILLDRR